MNLRRIFSLLLALMMLASPLPEALAVMAFAEEPPQETVAPMTEAPAEAPTEAPTEAVTEAPAEESTETATEETTDAPAAETTQAPTEAVPESPTEASTDVTQESTDVTEAPLDVPENQEISVTGIWLNNKSLTLNSDSGDTATLIVQFNPGNATAGKQITWEVMDESLISISTEGDYNEIAHISCLRAFGDTVIIARSEEGFYASCSVTVQTVIRVDNIADLNIATLENHADFTYAYTDTSMDKMYVAFGNTWLRTGDTLYVMDGSNKVISQGTGTAFRNRILLIPDSTVQFRFVTGDSQENSRFCVDTIVPQLKSDNLDISFIGDYQFCYTGKVIKPRESVHYTFPEGGEYELTQGADYAVAYSKNKNIGMGQATVTGKGIYAGLRCTRSFPIIPGDITTKVAVAENGLKVSWTASKGASHYYLYRYVDAYLDTDVISDSTDFQTADASALQTMALQGQSTALYQTLSAKTTSFVDTKVSGDHSYQYVVVPVKEFSDSLMRGHESITPEITWLKSVTDLTAIEVPSLHGYANPGILASWTPIDNADGYKVEFICADGTPIRDYIVSNPTGDYFRIDSCLYLPGYYTVIVTPYKQMTSGRIFGISASTQLPYSKPVDEVSALSGHNGMIVSINAIIPGMGTDNRGYQIQRSTNNGKTWTSVKTIAPGTVPGAQINTFVDTKAKSSGTDYVYRVKSFLKQGKKTFESDWTVSEPAPYLARPIINPITDNRNGGLKVTWSAVPGATGYRIAVKYQDPEGKNSYSGNLSLPLDEDPHSYMVTEPFFVHEDASAPGYYLYEVHAIQEIPGSNRYWGGPNSMGGFFRLAAPTVSAWNNSSDDGVFVSWDPVRNAGSYQIQRSANGGRTWKNVKTVSETSFIDSVERDGTFYVYRVRAIRKLDVTFYSPWSDITEDATVATLASSRITAQKLYSDGRVSFKFSKVAGADYYLVKRWEEGTDEPIFSDRIYPDQFGRNYTWVDTNPRQPGKRYNYEVSVYKDADGDGYTDTWAHNLFWLIHFDKSDIDVQNVTSGIQITAKNHYLTDQFQIWRSVNGGKWKKVKTINSSYAYDENYFDNNGNYYNNVAKVIWVDTGVKAGSIYSYKVIPIVKYPDALYTTCESNVAKCLRTPGPRLNAPVNEADGIRLTWSAPTRGAAVAKYQIYWTWWDNRNDPQLLATVSAKTISYVDQEVSPNKGYKYIVEAVLVDGTQIRSDAQMIYRLSAPVIDRSTTNGNSAQFYWSFQGSAGGYQIRYTPEGGTAKTATVRSGNPGQHKLTGLKANTPYFVEVRSLSVFNGRTYYSAWSEPFMYYNHIR